MRMRCLDGGLYYIILVAGDGVFVRVLIDMWYIWFVR